MKEKTIKVTIILGEGEFDDGTNTRVIEGLATKVEVTKNGLPEKNSAKIDISNLKLKDMEQMTFLSFIPLESRKNKVMVEAGNKGEELAVVFKGDITSSYADFSTAPDITFHVEAITAGWSVRMHDSPTSVNGQASAAELISQFAKQAGFGFINNGVEAQVQNSTYNGSPVTKAQEVAQEVGAELIMDDENWTLQAWDKPRGDAVIVNAKSGLIGYPTFTSDGVELSCFYDKRFQLSGQIKLESIVPKASGYWKIVKLTHSLAAYTQGDWISRIKGSWLQEGDEQNGGAENS